MQPSQSNKKGGKIMKKTLKKLLSLSLALLVALTIVAPASAASSVGKVTALQSYRVDDDEINLRWKKVVGADVYQIYVYKSGAWTYVGGTSKLQYEVENLASSKEYKFKVRAYKKTVLKKFMAPSLLYL
jgi:hypothetical protein